MKGNGKKAAELGSSRTPEVSVRRIFIAASLKFETIVGVDTVLPWVQGGTLR